MNAVLAQAVRWHLDGRVLVYRNKTVVLDWGDRWSPARNSVRNNLPSAAAMAAGRAKLARRTLGGAVYGTS